jgi:hypothetical protein
MAANAVTEVKARADAALANLRRQANGLDPYMERSDAPGEWTAREVLSHLLGEAGWHPDAFLRSFAVTDLPVLELDPGHHYMAAERQRMTVADFMAALEEQYRSVFAYVETLPERDLGRKARIPIFKTFMGTDEITIPVYLGAMFDYHWNDHAGQLAKIRKAVGLGSVSG